jgi:hypothetical protein
MRRQYVRVWSTDDSDYTMPLAEFVAEMQSVIEQQGAEPEGLEFRMELDRGAYADDYPTVDMWVQRPETDAEMHAREAVEREQFEDFRRQRERADRARYEAMKAKFEGLKP